MADPGNHTHTGEQVSMTKLNTADRYWRCHENKTALTKHMLPALIALPVNQVEAQIGRKASSKSRSKMR